MKGSCPVETKNPNCNLKHHTWNLKCPQRVARLQKTPNKSAVTQGVTPPSKQAMPPTKSMKDWPALSGYSTQPPAGTSIPPPAPVSTQNQTSRITPNLTAVIPNT